MWSVEWEAYAKAFAESAFAEKQARKQVQSDLAKAELKRIAEWRDSGETEEQIRLALIDSWKTENRQAKNKLQDTQRQKRLKLSELPIFKKLHLREKKE